MPRHQTFASALDKLLKRKYRWPKAGDRLLRSSKHPERDVRFSSHPAARDVFLWSGYMAAGAALVDKSRRSQTRSEDLLYPTLFCYRHGLEIAMKWTLDQYGPYVGVTYKLNHDLWELWCACKRVLVGLGADEADEGATVVVEAIIKEFHKLDPGGAFAFRYSRNKKGAVLKLPNEPIDLLNVKHVMEAVDHFFSGADGLLNENSQSMDY